ncbi:MAG: septum formation initiator family protein [Chloroflexi bacterium]|nr:septum formation initiator family protein [Chloroflexota bacterium]
MPRPQLRNLRPKIDPQVFARWGTRLILLLLMVLAGGLMVGFVRMTWTQHQINQANERQRAENEAQRAHNADLKGQAEFRESDVFAEQAAREQLGMAREGEVVLLPTIVVPASPLPSPQSSNPAAPASEMVAATVEAEIAPNYQRWWQALFPPEAVVP